MREGGEFRWAVRDVIHMRNSMKPDNIKFIPGQLKRDPDILTAAGMYDEDHRDAVDRQHQQEVIRKVVFSTRFSLTPTSHSEATNFTALFKSIELNQMERGVL